MKLSLLNIINLFIYGVWLFLLAHLSQRLKVRYCVRSKAVVLLLLIFCLLLLPLWESVIVLCFVVRYFMSILVLQSS